jgi:hypothetical protein
MRETGYKGQALGWLDRLTRCQRLVGCVTRSNEMAAKSARKADQGIPAQTTHDGPQKTPRVLVNTKQNLQR